MKYLVVFPTKNQEQVCYWCKQYAFGHDGTEDHEFITEKQFNDLTLQNTPDEDAYWFHPNQLDEYGSIQ